MNAKSGRQANFGKMQTLIVSSIASEITILTNLKSKQVAQNEQNCQKWIFTKTVPKVDFCKNKKMKNSQKRPPYGAICYIMLRYFMLSCLISSYDMIQYAML